MSDAAPDRFVFDTRFVQGLTEKYGPPSDPWDPHYALEPGAVSGEVGLAAVEGLAVEPLEDEPTRDFPRIDTEEASELVIDNGDQNYSAPTRNRTKRALEWMRRNKAVTAAGAITVASLMANPIGETVDAIGGTTALGVFGSMLALEAVWIYGARRVLHSAGLNIKLGSFRPSQIRATGKEIKAQFQALKDVDIAANVEANKSEFNVGISVNTLAAIGQIAVPSAAVMGNLPPSMWGVLAWGLIDGWATFIMRRAVIENSKRQRTVQANLISRA